MIRGLTRRVKNHVRERQRMIHLGDGNYVRADHILRVERFDGIQFTGTKPYRSVAVINETYGSFGSHEHVNRRINSYLAPEDLNERIRRATT